MRTVVKNKRDSNVMCVHFHKCTAHITAKQRDNASYYIVNYHVRCY